MEDVRKRIAKVGQELGEITARVTKIVGSPGVLDPSKGPLKPTSIGEAQDKELKKLLERKHELENELKKLRDQLA